MFINIINLKQQHNNKASQHRWCHVALFHTFDWQHLGSIQQQQFLGGSIRFALIHTGLII
jgi:hypothetical protein